MEEHNPQPLATDPLGARSATALRELQDRAQAAIEARREQAARLEADITAHLDAVAAALADEGATGTVDSQLDEQAQAEARRITVELEDARAAMKLERAAWESEREALEKERASAGVDRTKFDDERAAWETERSTVESEKAGWEKEHAAFEAERKSWDKERAAWETERTKLAAAAARLEAEVKTREADNQALAESDRTAQATLRKELAESEQKLLHERTEHEQQQAEWRKERTESDVQLEQSRQKFELAREDVQRLRTRVTELEQDLARRPETDKADSAELVALRAERDALAARIEQLESSPAGGADAGADQELADLRRRFELAVEDVRELKSKNAKLEAQVASAKQHAGTAGHAPDGDGMDWESQKRRMLASLAENGEEEEDDPVAQKERATIASTIEMTDAVVAEKDQVIAELKAQLEASGDHEMAAADAEREAEVNKLLDTDAVIAEHRGKIVQLEQEMEGKLRAAELELSVERAKIARQRAELEESRIELESQRQQGTHDSPAQPGAPKRRWLSKLGLTGEDQT